MLALGVLPALTDAVAESSLSYPSLLESAYYGLCGCFFDPLKSLHVMLFLVTIVCFWRGAYFSCLWPLTYFYNINDFSALGIGPEALTSGYVSAHPMLMYLAYASFAALFYLEANHKSPLLFSWSKVRVLRPALLTTVAAVVVGAAWAQLELNWGGWWS